jgi:hypothetical protein
MLHEVAAEELAEERFGAEGRFGRAKRGMPEAGLDILPDVGQRAALLRCGLDGDGHGNLPGADPENRFSRITSTDASSVRTQWRSIVEVQMQRVAPADSAARSVTKT